jgi:dolichol-phosphate mannosyltransferase
MKIGIIIPSFNEEACLPGLIRQIEAQGLGADICVVDDSPGDAAAAALAGLGLANLAVIRRGSKGGRGSAVLEGLRHLLKGPCDLFVEMDADMSHPPSRLPGLIKESSEKKLDLLIASRYLSGSSVGGRPLLRRLFSRAANGLAALLLGVPVNDYTSGFRVYSRRGAEAAAACGSAGTGFIVLPEVLVTLYYKGFSVAETPVVFTERVSGESSVDCKEIFGSLAGLLRVWRLKNKLTAN